jgi:hypothetical protein
MRSEWRSEGNSSMISRARVRAHAEGVRLIASFEASCQDFFRHHPVGLRFSTSSAGSEAQHAKDDDALRLKPDLPSLHGERHPGIEHLSVLSNSLGGKPHCGTLVPLLSLCLRHRSFFKTCEGTGGENKYLGGRVRGVGCGLDGGVLCRTPTCVARRWESDDRARHRGAQGERRGCP